MVANHILAAVALLALAASPARAERCQLLTTGSGGEPQFTTLEIDLDSGRALSPETLPQGATALMCPRASIIPLAEDVRVLTAWGISFGIAEEGPRALWISARRGRLRTTVDHGRLSRVERAALDRWLRVAQLRFNEALRGDKQR